MAERRTRGTGSIRFSARSSQVSERIVLATTGLTCVSAGAGWLAIAVPILVAAPAYFHSAMTFGELMVIVGAFNQVQQALRWFVDNFSTIADWQATLLRVASFRKTLLTMDKLGESESQIALDEWERDFDRHRRPADRLALGLHHAQRKPHVELRPGERILIVGEAG